MLYKLKTAKIFEKPQSRSIDGAEDDPFSIQLISLCPESRKLAVAGASSYVILFKFRKLESASEISVSRVSFSRRAILSCSLSVSVPIAVSIPIIKKKNEMITVLKSFRTVALDVAARAILPSEVVCLPRQSLSPFPSPLSTKICVSE